MFRFLTCRKHLVSLVVSLCAVGSEEPLRFLYRVCEKCPAWRTRTHFSASSEITAWMRRTQGYKVRKWSRDIVHLFEWSALPCESRERMKKQHDSYRFHHKLYLGLLPANVTVNSVYVMLHCALMGGLYGAFLATETWHKHKLTILHHVLCQAECTVCLGHLQTPPCVMHDGQYDVTTSPDNIHYIL